MFFRGILFDIPKKLRSKSYFGHSTTYIVQLDRFTTSKEKLYLIDLRVT